MVKTAVYCFQCIVFKIQFNIFVFRDGIVVRTIWDYHHHAPQFLDWLDLVNKQCPHVFNPVSLMRWNVHKRYLLDLEKRKIPIVPSVCMERGTKVNLSKLTSQSFSSGGSNKFFIVKPCIGAVSN
jgi:hypothetical protein